MRWLLVSLLILSAAPFACGRSSLNMPSGRRVSCPDGTCPEGLICESGLCVLPDDPSTDTGGGGGNHMASTGGSWGGTKDPPGAGSGGSSSWQETGGRAPVPGSPAGAGAIAGMPATAGFSAGNPASPSTSVGGRSGPGGMSTGGVFTVGGASSMGGLGSGGASKSSSSSGRPNGDVTFYSGRAQGLMTGWAWVALASLDSMTSPTCNGGLITSATPCVTETRWDALDSLCMSGSIPALPIPPTQSDYDNDWGMEIGVNAQEPRDAVGPAMSSFTSVTFTFSGRPQAGVRAFIHRKGDPDGITYCFDSIATGRTVSLSKFNTRCWGDPNTVYLTPTDLPKIDQIGLMVLSSDSPITVSNLCLTRISFN
jgi:hypothetical protein